MQMNKQFAEIAIQYVYNLLGHTAVHDDHTFELDHSKYDYYVRTFWNTLTEKYPQLNHTTKIVIMDTRTRYIEWMIPDYYRIPDNLEDMPYEWIRSRGLKSRLYRIAYEITGKDKWKRKGYIKSYYSPSKKPLQEETELFEYMDRIYFSQLNEPLRIAMRVAYIPLTDTLYIGFLARFKGLDHLIQEQIWK